jgi:2-C-methyl-D-erythritol 2,4-cyclodiphosphate synthase
LFGHSDGDVVLHCVTDAILGAAGLGDIGMYFPDNDDTWKDADSRELLLSVKEELDERRWEVINLDIIVNAEEPKLTPFKAQMKRSISSILGVDFNNVNVKAKTAEGLGPVGQGLAIESTATVLLRRRIKRSL